MSSSRREDGGAALALAGLRATLVAVMFVSEQLVDARQLADTSFFVMLALASAYALAGIAMALNSAHSIIQDALSRLQPGLDILLLVGLAYTSGGAFSDVRKAFFVIPLAAAFTERPRSTASWSLLAVTAFSLQAVLAGGHPVGALNTWERMLVNQDLYLTWTGAAATLLAFTLRRRSRQTEELSDSRQRLVTHAIDAVERERTRLANALHDSPVQNLIAARHDLRRAERSGDTASFRRLHEAIDLTIAELREEIFNLHPHVLDHVGLRAALEQVASRHDGSGTQVRVEIPSGEDFANRQVLFALGRELLANAAKHAHAREIRLTLTHKQDMVMLLVQDDGRGIPEGRISQALLDGHIGLASVSERVTALGGMLEIKTAEGEGTCVWVTLPAPRDSPAQARPAILRRALNGLQNTEISDRGTPPDPAWVSTG
jgi:two-component system, NarL family, sensor kinase